jgi:hypothetical protein
MSGRDPLKLESLNGSMQHEHHMQQVTQWINDHHFPATAKR